MINNQRGEIATVVALVGLSVVTAGVFIANRLVATGPRDTPLAHNRFPTIASSITKKIYSLEDTYVDKKNPGQNYCRKQLQVDGDPVNISYLKFDLRKIKNNITSAKLFLKVTDSSNSIQRVRAVSSNNWSECTLTYNKKPSFQNTIASFNGSSTGKWVAIDISSYIKNKRGQLISLAIDSKGSNKIAFFSRENSTYKPYLEIKTGGSGIIPTSRPTTSPTVIPISPSVGTITPTNVPADAEIIFSPASVNVPPATKVSVMVNAGNKEAAFTRVVFNFDPAKIKLTSEITINSNMSTVVEKTPLSAANTSGKIIIVAALSPTDTAPTGSFELASFNIDANTSVSDAADTLIFDRNDSQVVDKSGPQLLVNYYDATVSVNGPSACVRGEMGNLNCSIDGCVDTADFELFNQDFGKTTAELNIVSGSHTPDLVTDANNMIDTADYEILRANFGSCQ